MYPSEPINNPSTPFVDQIIGGLHPGSIITIKGFSSYSAEHFIINLAMGPKCVENDPNRSPIAFHASVRFHQDYVARNSFYGGNWGPEEGSKPNGIFPFTRSQRFEITILVTSTDYKFSVNGKHYISFAHRLPLNQVSTLHILKDIIIDKIVLTEGPYSHYPPSQPFDSPPSSIKQGAFYNLVVPFEHFIPGGYYVGRMIYLSGKPTACANNFTIDLAYGYSSDIAFHMSIRFSDRVVVRNSFLNGSWGMEERNAHSFPFGRNHNFEVRIQSELGQFVVLVNGQHFCNFNHRLNYNRVEKIKVGGSVSINSLIFS